MKNIELKDVTKEFLAKATPGKGSIEYEPGFDFKKHKKEKETALWLLDTFGGKIIVLKENYKYQVKNPDYKWNDRFWELKGISSKASLENALRKAFKQIEYFPGGIIIDISNYKESANGLYGIIYRRLTVINHNRGFFIIKRKSKLICVYKY